MSSSEIGTARELIVTEINIVTNDPDTRAKFTLALQGLSDASTLTAAEYIVALRANNAELTYQILSDHLGMGV